MLQFKFTLYCTPTSNLKSFFFIFLQFSTFIYARTLSDLKTSKTQADIDTESRYNCITVNTYLHRVWIYTSTHTHTSYLLVILFIRCSLISDQTNHDKAKRTIQNSSNLHQTKFSYNSSLFNFAFVLSAQSRTFVSILTKSHKLWLNHKRIKIKSESWITILKLS